MKLINFNRYKSYLNIINRYKSYLNINRYKSYAHYLFYVVAFAGFVTFVYMSIPLFFDYEKSKISIENKIYKEFNLKTSINGTIKYVFLPSPQIKISNLTIKDPIKESKDLGEVENVTLPIPFKKLTSIKKMEFNKLKLKNLNINLNLNDFNKYRKKFFPQFKSKDIEARDGEIKFFDDKKYITKLNNINFTYISRVTIDETTLKGKLFENNITINFKNKKNSKNSKIFSIKYPNLKFGANIVLSEGDSKNIFQGNGSLTLNRSKINLVFDWKENLLNIEKGNIRNEFLNGKINGEIKFLPFFNFDLNLDLNSFNFKTLAQIIMKKDDNFIHNFLLLNNKINGSANISIDKIYSGVKLVKSLESKINFVNRDIIIERLLISLGKLGAADVTGMIKDGAKLIFNKNLFIDNEKYFYSRFGIYNNSTEPKNLFISGSFNIKKPKIFLDELTADVDLKKEDISYYQKEFNQTVLNNGYKTLFDFRNLREYVKIISNENN